MVTDAGGPRFRVVKYKEIGIQPWRYRLVGLKGETLLTSKGYLTRWQRDKAIHNAGFVSGGIPIESE